MADLETDLVTDFVTDIIAGTGSDVLFANIELEDGANMLTEDGGLILLG